MARFGKNLKTWLTDRNIRKAHFKYAWAKMRGKDALLRTSDGAAYSAGPNFNDYWSIVRQHPEAEEIALYRELVPADGTVVFDVGANIGMYSVMAGRGRALKRLIAFEPIHRYCNAWHKNIERNGIANATLVQSAVGDYCGVANFTVDLSTPLHNRISSDGNSTLPKTGVSITTLDAAAESFGIERIDLLKIDVEGAEPFVLKGARKLLEQRRVECLFVEFIIEFMEEMGADVGVVYQSLVDMGYDFFAITPEGKIGERLDRAAAIDGRRAGPDAKERDFWGLNVVIKKRP